MKKPTNRTYDKDAEKYMSKLPHDKKARMEGLLDKVENGYPLKADHYKPMKKYGCKGIKELKLNTCRLVLHVKKERVHVVLGFNKDKAHTPTWVENSIEEYLKKDA